MFAQCPGVIESFTRHGENIATCSEEWVVKASSFDPASLDPLLIAGAVGAGYFCLVPVWAAGLGVRYLLTSIKIF